MSKAILVVVTIVVCTIGIAYHKKGRCSLILGNNAENQLCLRFECTKSGGGTDHPTGSILMRSAHE